MRLLALIEQAAVIARILTHLGLPIEVPAPSPTGSPAIVRHDASVGRDDDDLPAA